MLIDIVEVRAREPHRLWLPFEDGVEGEVKLDELVEFRGIFAPMRVPEAFRQVAVSTDLGTIVWPNGADLDPDVLYATVTGSPVDTDKVRD